MTDPLDRLSPETHVRLLRAAPVALQPSAAAESLRFALWYAELGWRVLPIHAIDLVTRACTCADAECTRPAKHPVQANWPALATSNPEVIRETRKRWPWAGVGIATGQASGIVALDIDGARGEASLAELVAKLGPMPPGPIMRTARGWHPYFRPPLGVKLSNRVGFLPGLDLRADNGFVVAAPSVHESGFVYAFEAGASPTERELAAPEWLLAALAESSAPAPRPTPPPTAAPVAERSSVGERRSEKWAQAGLEQECARVRTSSPGTRNDSLNKAAFSIGTLIGGGRLDFDAARGALVEAALACGLSKSEATKHTEHGLRDGMTAETRNAPTRDRPDWTPPTDGTNGRARAAHGGGSGAANGGGGGGGDGGEPPGPGPDDPEVAPANARGKRPTRPRATIGTFLETLRTDEQWAGALGADERAGTIVWLSPPPWRAAERAQWQPQELCDADFPRTAEWFEASRDIAVSPTSAPLRGALVVAADEHRFDRVRDYLESLRWDGTPRLGTLFTRYFGAGDDDDDDDDRRYLSAVGTCALIGAVARTLMPGAKLDSVPILVGAQGGGKSTAIKILAGADYFADGLPDLRSKDAGDYLRGPWLVELSELDALKRPELGAIKAFLSRTHDRFRPAYGRATASFPRRCTFWGSTNEDGFLGDSTGNRRFWPVSVGKIDLAALRRDRDQLWAEAVHRFRAGEPWHLHSQQLVAAAARAQKAREVTDVWEPMISAFLASRDHVTPTEVLRACLGLQIEHCGRAERNRVVAVLRQLGWTRRQQRDGSARSWSYVAPVRRA